MPTSMLFVLIIVVSVGLSIAPVFRDQHEFLQMYSDKMRPDFPVTSEELQQAINEDPDNATSIATQTTNNRLKLMWSHHDDAELDRLARSIRIGFYRTLAIFGIVLVLIIIASLSARGTN